MKEYVRQRILSIKRELTDAQKARAIESIYQVLTEHGYNDYDSVRLITEVILESMNDLRYLLDENIINYDYRNKDKEQEEDENE